MDHAAERHHRAAGIGRQSADRDVVGEHRHFGVVARPSRRAVGTDGSATHNRADHGNVASSRQFRNAVGIAGEQLSSGRDFNPTAGIGAQVLRRADSGSAILEAAALLGGDRSKADVAGRGDIPTRIRAGLSGDHAIEHDVVRRDDLHGTGNRQITRHPHAGAGGIRRLEDHRVVRGVGARRRRHNPAAEVDRLGFQRQLARSAEAAIRPHLHLASGRRQVEAREFVVDPQRHIDVDILAGGDRERAFVQRPHFAARDQVDARIRPARRVRLQHDFVARFDQAADVDVGVVRDANIAARAGGLQTALNVRVAATARHEDIPARRLQAATHGQLEFGDAVANARVAGRIHRDRTGSHHAAANPDARLWRGRGPDRHRRAGAIRENSQPFGRRGHGIRRDHEAQFRDIARTFHKRGRRPLFGLGNRRRAGQRERVLAAQQHSAAARAGCQFESSGIEAVRCAHRPRGIGRRRHLEVGRQHRRLDVIDQLDNVRVVRRRRRGDRDIAAIGPRAAIDRDSQRHIVREHRLRGAQPIGGHQFMVVRGRHDFDAARAKQFDRAGRPVGTQLRRTLQ